MKIHQQQLELIDNGKQYHHLFSESYVWSIYIPCTSIVTLTLREPKLLVASQVYTPPILVELLNVLALVSASENGRSGSLNEYNLVASSRVAFGLKPFRTAWESRLFVLLELLTSKKFSKNEAKSGTGC